MLHIFSRMLLSRIIFLPNKQVMDIKWLFRGKFCLILFSSCFIDVFSWFKHWLSDHMRQYCGTVSFSTPSDVHSCFFFFAITSSKEAEMIGLRADWTELLQWSVTTHEEASKQHLLFEFCYKFWMLSFCFFCTYQKLKPLCDYWISETL